MHKIDVSYSCICMSPFAVVKMFVTLFIIVLLNYYDIKVISTLLTILINTFLSEFYLVILQPQYKVYSIDKKCVGTYYIQISTNI